METSGVKWQNKLLSMLIRQIIIGRMCNGSGKVDASSYDQSGSIQGKGM